MIGKKLSPIIQEIATTICEFNCAEKKPNWNDESIIDGSIIMMSIIMDKMYDLQDKEKIDLQDRCNMAEACGNDFRKLIKTYTGIDTIEEIKKL